MVEHFLGKEEVTGSNPVVGSIELGSAKVFLASHAAARGLDTGLICRVFRGETDVQGEI